MMLSNRDHNIFISYHSWVRVPIAVLPYFFSPASSVYVLRLYSASFPFVFLCSIILMLVLFQHKIPFFFMWTNGQMVLAVFLKVQTQQWNRQWKTWKFIYMSLEREQQQLLVMAHPIHLFRKLAERCTYAFHFNILPCKVICRFFSSGNRWLKY